MIKNFNINKKSTQSGRSMIEMLGVLAIVGVLSVGGIAGYSKAMQKFKINKSIDQISHIVANIRALYAQQTTYDGLNANTAIDMGVVPSEMIDAPFLINPFNGNSWIDSGYFDNNKVFSISYEGLDVETCIALASYDWGDKHSSGLIGVEIASVSYYTISNLSSGNMGNFRCDGISSGYYICAGKKMSLVDAQQNCNYIFNEHGHLAFNLVYQ